jgi:hypothetical protein
MKGIQGLKWEKITGECSRLYNYIMRGFVKCSLHQTLPKPSIYHVRADEK